MKKTLAMLAAVAVAGTVSADLSVNWGNGAGVVDEGGSAAAGPYCENAIIQIIWSATGITTASGNSYAVGAGAVLSGEYILTSGTTGSYGLWSGLGGTFTDADVGGSDIHSGKIFTRIFQDGTPSAGDYFYDVGVMDADLEYNPGPPPVASTVTDMTNPTGANGSAINITDGGTTVIPEPATIGLMGVAGLGMFLARRKVRR